LSDIAGLLVAARYVDSSYPVGGFAHSWGLETAGARGDVTDAASLARAVSAVLRHQVAPTDAVAAAGCCRAAGRGDTAAFIAIDRRLAVTRAARETREASTRTGRRLLETAARAERDVWLSWLWDELRAGRTAGNHAAVLGAVAGRRGLAPAGAAALALWASLNGFLNAAMRLLPISHDDVQQILTDLLPVCVALAEGAAVEEPLAMGGGAPLAEIWSMLHETARVRLFAS
jgi:urease accessory protein